MKAAKDQLMQLGRWIFHIAELVDAPENISEEHIMPRALRDYSNISFNLEHLQDDVGGNLERNWTLCESSKRVHTLAKVITYCVIKGDGNWLFVTSKSANHRTVFEFCKEPYPGKPQTEGIFKLFARCIQVVVEAYQRDSGKVRKNFCAGPPRTHYTEEPMHGGYSTSDFKQSIADEALHHLSEFKTFLAHGVSNAFANKAQMKQCYIEFSIRRDEFLMHLNQQQQTLLLSVMDGIWKLFSSEEKKNMQDFL